MYVDAHTLSTRVPQVGDRLAPLPPAIWSVPLGSLCATGAQGLGGDCSLNPMTWDDCLREGVVWLSDTVEDAYDWVAEKVSDFDDWMRENVGDYGYSFVSDIVIKYGGEFFMVLGEAVDGAIDLIIVKGGKYLGAIVAASACAAGNIIGVPLDPRVCAAIGAAIGDAAGDYVKDVKEDIKDRWKDKPKHIPPDAGTQALLQGMATPTCGTPGREYHGEEPSPAMTPCEKAQWWNDFRSVASQITGHPNLDYYSCRAQGEQFLCNMGNLRAKGMLTDNESFQQLFTDRRLQANTIQGITKYLGTPVRRVTPAVLQAASSRGQQRKKATPKKRTWAQAGIAVDDSVDVSTWLIAAGIVAATTVFVIRRRRGR